MNHLETARERARRERERDRDRKAAGRAAAREIADTCPPCKCPETRKRIESDLRFALVTLFASRFNLEFSEDHEQLIKDIERAINDGEQAARALPRGTGKTSILLCSIIVAILTGKHYFATLIGATAEAAKELLEQITTELETNDALYAYFPEIIHAIRCLEGIHQRKLLWNGEPVQQNWKKDRIILPSIPGVPGASAIIKVAGLLGRIRGMNFQRPDGKNARPTLALIDDPSTDASAISPKENEKRESVICGTIPGLAGPGKKIAVLVAITVKAPGDLADRLLDRTKHPEWRGKRTGLMRSMPTNVDLWNQYAEILRECQRADEPIDRATEFYRANQTEMDAGAVPSWPQRFNADEASAVQYAMNLKIANPVSFASEYQNQPLVTEDRTKQTDPDRVVMRVNQRARGVVPLEVETLTTGVDVQKNYLVFSVVGFAPNATPFQIDYGTFPKQPTNYFDRRSATRTIESEFKGMEPDAALWAALDGLIAQLMGGAWKREDGAAMSMKKVAIDVRYKGQLIKKYVRQSSHRDVLLPAQGIHVKPGSPGINEREAKPGEISKNDFRLPPLGAGQIARTVSFDSAEFISRVHDCLNTPLGSPGAMTLFQAEPHVHRCFVDQLCAEYSTLHEVNGRKKRIWEPKPNGGDNDFLDSTKLAFVAAYVSGVEPRYGVASAAKPKTQPSRAPRYAVI